MVPATSTSASHGNEPSVRWELARERDDAEAVVVSCLHEVEDGVAQLSVVLDKEFVEHIRLWELCRRGFALGGMLLLDCRRREVSLEDVEALGSVARPRHGNDDHSQTAEQLAGLLRKEGRWSAS